KHYAAHLKDMIDNVRGARKRNEENRRTNDPADGRILWLVKTESSFCSFAQSTLRTPARPRHECSVLAAGFF
ncbi:MAG: hypothetical protein AAF405_07320, partial [Pseudomonadota bacterium]